MDLRQLNALMAVADQGSFSAAADALSTVQSNVSAHVARLENELGAILFDRGAGHLTDEGRVVVDRARRVAEELDAISSEVAGMQHHVQGTARIGTIGTSARWLVPKLLEKAQQLHPGLRLVVAEGATAQLGRQVRSGQLDLAVLNFPVREDDLSTSPLFEEDLVLVVSAEDPLAGRGPLELSDLAGVPLLLPLPGMAFREALDAATVAARVDLTSRADIDGVRLIATLTFEGLGPAILPATAVPAYLRDRWRLVAVHGLPRRRIGVAQRRRGLLSTPARALLEILHGLVGDPRAIPEGVHI